MGRLATVTEGERLTTYDYDSNSNRTGKTVTENGGTLTETYVYDVCGRLLSLDSNGVFTTYVYDNNGNQISVTTGSDVDTFVYDTKNRLVSTSTNGVETAEFSYYANGLRKTKDDELYIYDGKNILAEIDSTDIRLNVYGNALLFTIQGTITTENEVTFIDGKIAYAYEFNLHGDVVKVLGIAGIVLNTYTYDAFGVITSQSATVANTFYYAGYQYDDETGLYYLRSRYYNAETARFITEDGFKGYYDDPLSLNRYTYCHNSPIIYFDPDGEFWNLIAGIVGTLVGAAVGAAIDVASQLLSGANLSNVDWKSVGASAAEGAIVGGVAGLTAGNPAAMALASAAGNAVKQGINKGFENIDYGEVAVSGVVGFVSAGAGQVTSKMIGGVASTTLNKFAKVSLGALAEGTIEAGVDLGSQALEILVGKRDSIDLTQTAFAFGAGMLTGAFQTDAEIKKSSEITVAKKGSTGRENPNNLKEQLAMEQVKSNPLDNSEVLDFDMNDPRWSSKEGWEKRQAIFELSDGVVNIHFNYNPFENLFDDFKFKLPKE